MNRHPLIKSYKDAIVFAFVLCLAIQLPGAVLNADIRGDFAGPPVNYWPRPLWFWNNTEVKIEILHEQMQSLQF